MMVLPKPFVAVLASLMGFTGLFLGGCEPTSQQAKQIIVKCGTVAGLTAEQQAKIAAELDALPPNSLIADVVIPDWIRQRDEASACAGKAVGKTVK